ncbi:MAG: FAD-dependent oxidoreductase [Endomicrobiales bacterium]|nr:FAD-dependent oxidoreductase [Endomicrobiales bacterium]
MKNKIHIIGAGLTGLSAASALSRGGYDVTVYEGNAYVGGMASTFESGGFKLDLGPHKIFSVIEDTQSKVLDLLGPEALKVKKRSRIRLRGNFLDYPVGLKGILAAFGPVLAVKCFVSYLKAAAAGLARGEKSENFEDWVTGRFGKCIYELVFKPYAKKLWGEPANLHVEIAERRIAAPNLLKMIKEFIFGIRRGRVINAEEFHFPKHGAAIISERLAGEHLKAGGKLRLSSEIVGIAVEGGKIARFDVNGGESVQVNPGDILINTSPLRILKSIMTPMTEKVRDAIDELKTKDLVLEYVIFKKGSLTKDNWIFFPEEDVLFNRMFEQKNFSPFMGPKDRTALCFEITHHRGDSVSKMSENDVFEKVIKIIEDCGIAGREDVLEHFDRRLEDVYPIYDVNYERNKEVVFGYLDSIENLYSVGRNGDFNYSGMIDCVDIGFRTAEAITNGLKASELRKEFRGYVVID